MQPVSQVAANLASGRFARPPSAEPSQNVSEPVRLAVSNEAADTPDSVALPDAAGGTRTPPKELAVGRASSLPTSSLVDIGRLEAYPTAHDGSTTSVTLVGQSTWSESRGDPYFIAVASLGVQAAEALAHAHGEGMLHRDVKPSNLLVDIQGDIWLTDFGLAKSTGAEDLTRSGDIVGTLRYMAPERFSGRTDGRSDVYGLGLVLYELLTLQPAFEAEERPKLIDLILHSEPARPRSIDVRIPSDLETIVLKAIAKEPPDRYQTPAEMADDLRQFLRDRPIRARPVGAVEQLWRWSRRNPAIAWLTAAVATLVVGLGGAGVVLHLVRGERDRAIVAESAAREATTRAVSAEREATARRHLAEAARLRHSGETGRKARCLDELGRAMRLNPSEELRFELRNEAIAALAMTDVRFGRTWPGVPERTLSIAVDPDHERYARSHQDGTICIRRLADDHELLRFAVAGDQPKQAIYFSPDGRMLLGHSNFDGGRVQMWDTASAAPVLPQAIDGCLGFDFSPDGRTLVVARSDRSVSLIDLATCAETRRFQTPAVAHWVAFHPDGRRLAISFREREAAVQVWDAESAAATAELPTFGAVHYVAWHPDGKHLALAMGRGAVELWDMAPLKRTATIAVSATPVTWIEFDPTGDFLLTAGWDGYTRLWQTHAQRQVAALPGAWPGWSRDGRVLAARSVDGSVDGLQLVELDQSDEYAVLNGFA